MSTDSRHPRTRQQKGYYEQRLRRIESILLLTPIDRPQYSAICEVFWHYRRLIADIEDCQNG